MLPWIDGITTAVYSITPLFVFVIIAFSLMRRNRLSLWPLIVAVCVNGLFAVIINLAGQGVRFTHWTLVPRLAGLGFHFGGYFFNLVFIFNTLLFLALIFTIAREQFLQRERQSRIELELKSAREVQQILVPEETPAIPGLSIASIYRPAEEVGGDFFQVIALDGGGALIALGDVSGKGLKAAMTVSLIVGSLRTLADFTQNPAGILQGLNRRLMGRTDGGFVTCLIALIEANGATTMANAGHLAPFRDKEELPINGSLPLGLAPDAAYDELVFVPARGGDTHFLYRWHFGGAEFDGRAVWLRAPGGTGAVRSYGRADGRGSTQLRAAGRHYDFPGYQAGSVRTRARSQVEPGYANRGGLSP